MKKCIIISDSFKGSLSSKEISTIFKASCNKYFPNCEVISLPIADGGEGTVDCFASMLKGEYKNVSSLSPLKEKINTRYFMTEDKTAIIEVASSASLLLAKGQVLKASTIGVGIEIKDAINNGAKKIILGLGGSGTNDMGVGAAYALGTKFYDKNSKEFLPIGENINQIMSIDTSIMDGLLDGISVIAMCDVTNPLCGKSGASYVYGPQKGAKDNELDFLDNNLNYLSSVIEKTKNKKIKDVPGAGAAGGFGAGVLAFFNGELKRGIDTILETISFVKYLENCDVVFTGEGRIDYQSAYGKVISGILKYTKKNNVPCVAIVGSTTFDAEKLIDEDSGLTSIITTTRQALEFEKLVPYSKEFYKATIDNVMALLRLGEKLV